LPFAEWLALTGRARDHVPGPVAAIGAAYRAFLFRLPLKLDGQLASFRWTSRSSRSPTRYGVSRTQRMSSPYKSVSHKTRKRPSAGGNIRRRRRADLVAQDFDLYGWRCACCGSGDVAVAQHTARSCPAEMPRRVACTAGFGAMVSPRDSRSCACPARTPKDTGERCTLAHIDSKKRRYACNEIKLLVKEFGTDRTARDGHARAARCATPQPVQ
jgi:hypothetical protein